MLIEKSCLDATFEFLTLSEGLSAVSSPYNYLHLRHILKLFYFTRFFYQDLLPSALTKRGNKQAFQRSKTCPLVTKNWTNQESEPTSSREWHKKPYAESFITIRPQIAKLWPKMVSPWWPKNELIKKMTPPSVVDGKTVLTLWISLDLANRRPSYDQKGAPCWPKNELW